MENVVKGIVKDSVDCSFINKEGNKVIMSDNLINIPSLGVSLHIRGKNVFQDFQEVNLIPHPTKERNMIWFSISSLAENE